jgi:general secretion pathway protein G
MSASWIVDTARERHSCRGRWSGPVGRCLGLLGRHATSQRGLSLIELLIIVAVIATLATIALLFFSDLTEQTRVARAVADLTTIGGEIDTFEYMNDRLPNNLAEIGRASFKDPWGNAYVYQSFAATPQGQWRKDHNLVPINSSFDLFSKGKDGQSQPPLTASASRDDIVRANDGNFIGLASRY